MQLTRAVEILGRLRDGEDPRTGRPLPAGSPAQDLDVVRALYTVLASLPGGDGAACEPSEDPAPRPPRPAALRSGQPWTDDEDARLAAAFDGGETFGKLSAAFGRSSKAIRLRLVKLGRLSPDDAPAPRSRGPSREPAAAPAG